MKKWVIRILVVIFVAGVGIAGVNVYRTITVPKKVHYHAGFVVFDNNKKVDFSKAKYMDPEPCTLKANTTPSTADIQLEKAHLHDYVGDVVHVERSGAMWKDLFTNLHYSIDYATAIAYINGKQVSNFQQQRIHDDDSLVVFIGKNNISKDLKQAVTKKHIEQEANKSESCG